MMFISVWIISCATTTKNQTPPISSTEYPHQTPWIWSRNADNHQLLTQLPPLPTHHPQLDKEIEETPFYNMVQPQDGLWTIAEHLGLSLEEVLIGSERQWYLNAGEHIPIYSPSKFALSAISFQPQLSISEPNCQFTTGNSLTCFGWVYNRSEQAVSTVALHISVKNRRGDVIAETRTTTAYHLLQPTDRAPFRAIFPSVPDDEFFISTRLEAVTPTLGLLTAISANHEHITKPTISHPYVTIDAEIGPHRAIKGTVRVVASIFTEKGALISYRVREISDFSAQNEHRTIVIVVPVLSNTAQLYHHLHLEAYINEES